MGVADCDRRTGRNFGRDQGYNASHTDPVAPVFKSKSNSKGVKVNAPSVDPPNKHKNQVSGRDKPASSRAHMKTSEATRTSTAVKPQPPPSTSMSVDDPGKGKDTFTIQTASGYTAGGTIVNGNIQVH